MRTRIISGLVMAAFGVAALLIGGYTAGIIIMIISLGAYYELCKACQVITDKPVNAANVFGYIAIVVYYMNLLFVPEQYKFMVYHVLLVVIVLLELAVYVLAFPRFNSNQIMSSMFGLLYAPFMLSFLYMILMRFEHGRLVVFLVFVCSSFSDVFAYFVGVKLGKHKLAPKLSPKKSIEGSIGGILGAALVGLIYGVILYKLGIYGAEVMGIFSVCGAIGSVVSQIGDLAASAIKRDHDIKDYSQLIPGHGGIMDRMDSIVVTAPIIYYLALLWIK